MGANSGRGRRLRLWLMLQMLQMLQILQGEKWKGLMLQMLADSVVGEGE